MHKLLDALRRRKDAEPKEDAAKRDDPLAQARPMHVDSEDDRPTREDKEAQAAARRAGGSGGGLGM
jgi:hypothetical protein